MKKVSFDESPTLPLDEGKVLAKLTEKTWFSPLTGIIGFASLLTPLLLHWGTLGVVGMLSASAIGLHLYFKNSREEFLTDCRRELAQESNDRQNSELKRIIRNLENSMHGHYSDLLRKILNNKIAIEREIHNGEHPTETINRMETIVDGLCETVCENINNYLSSMNDLGKTLIDGDEERLKEMSEQWHETHSNLLRSARAIEKINTELSYKLAKAARSEPLFPEVGSPLSSSRPSTARFSASLLETAEEEAQILERINTRLSE